jgi:hypothetical protein
MNAFEILFTLTLLRLVLPFGVLLLIGEWVRRNLGHSRIIS